MNYALEVDNIKCEGCASRIVTQLQALDGVTEVEVSVSDGIVIWQSEQDNSQQVAQRLVELGYPELGSIQGVQAVSAKAKSYVSCALGQLTSKSELNKQN